MKKHILKLMALLIFTSVAVQSCSVEYRERHRKAVEEHHDHDHDNNHNYHNY